jgi:2-C-methyl-D-erythritol 2,4-cyclodiphosphate synthase
MVGLGYDVHRLAEGRPLVLAGVTIPSEKGAVAHSDGDVVFHALVDALLGAAALGDIGEWFPDTDARWKGASSTQFVEHTIGLLASHGLRVVNIDATLVLESPKISAFKQEMRENISRACQLPVQRVSVKATTSERIGFVGRGEGVEATVIVLIGTIEPR